MKCKLCGKRTSIWYKKLYDDRHGYPGYFDVYICKNCGFAQTKPQISKKEIGKLYEKYYPRQNVDLSKIKLSNYKKPNRFSLWSKGLLTGSHYWVKPGSKVLDVGAGLGYSLLWLKGMGCDAYGLDPDVHAKKVAKKFNLKFHIGFIEDNPFKGERFDYVIASQTLEHTNDPIKFLKLCKKRLRSGGEIVMSFPNAGSLSRHFFGRNWLHWHIPYHLNHFDKKSVRELAKRSGLKIDKIKTVTPNLWTNIQIRRLINRPKIGTRDYFWDGGKTRNKKNKSAKVSPYLRVMLNFLERHNYINRLIDFLGLGDSLIVFMSSS